MNKILLQTTIPATADDWSISRFSLLTRLLREQRNEGGAPLFDVTTRDREALGTSDSVLSTLDRSDFDQMWLFAADEGNGLNADGCRAISDFRRSGRGLMVTRDHMDLGSSICSLAGVGAAHHFHTLNKGPIELQMRDDLYTTQISWPNFHSGANGDYQTINVLEPTHAILRNLSSPTGTIRYLPAHPHEGAVSAPIDEDARVIASGRSKVTGRPFNIAVAFEAGGGRGRAQLRKAHFIISRITTGIHILARRLLSMSRRAMPSCAIPRRPMTHIAMRSILRDGCQVKNNAALPPGCAAICDVRRVVTCHGQTIPPM